MAVFDILDREFMEVEALLDLLELVLGRVMQGDPDEGAGQAAPFRYVIEPDIGNPMPIAIDHAVDQHARASFDLTGA